MVGEKNHQSNWNAKFIFMFHFYMLRSKWND